MRVGSSSSACAAARSSTGRTDPSPTKPQLVVRIDRSKAADLSVAISDIGATLETLLGGRRVTDPARQPAVRRGGAGGGRRPRKTPRDLTRLYVKARTGNLVQLGNLVTYRENVVPESYPHFNRLRSVTVSAQINLGSTLGDSAGLPRARGADAAARGVQLRVGWRHAQTSWTGAATRS